MAAKFDWTDGGAQSFTTDLKLQGQMLDTNQPAYYTEALDGSVVEVVTVGSGQNEAIQFIRHEADDSGLRDLLDAMRRGISVTYTPDTGAPGTTFTVTAIPPVPAAEMENEGRQNLWRAGPIRLRRLDGGAFAP